MMSGAGIPCQETQRAGRVGTTVGEQAFVQDKELCEKFQNIHHFIYSSEIILNKKNFENMLPGFTNFDIDLIYCKSVS